MNFKQRRFNKGSLAKQTAIDKNFASKLGKNSANCKFYRETRDLNKFGEKRKDKKMKLDVRHNKTERRHLSAWCTHSHHACRAHLELPPAYHQRWQHACQNERERGSKSRDRNAKGKKSVWQLQTTAARTTRRSNQKQLFYNLSFPINSRYARRRRNTSEINNANNNNNNNFGVLTQRRAWVMFLICLRSEESRNPQKISQWENKNSMR